MPTCDQYGHVFRKQRKQCDCWGDVREDGTAMFPKAADPDMLIINGEVVGRVEKATFNYHEGLSHLYIRARTIIAGPFE